MDNSCKEKTKLTEAESGRWPRQETLSLLEIRTRLNPLFKDAVTKKSPLWDEVSRLMAEEHGYQRSGKKCKEKLDNLYKYYKKTKGLNKGRKDGRNYRFFKQLETLYAGNNPNESKLLDQDTPLQILNVSDSEDSKEEEYGIEWSLMVKVMIDTQVKRVMEMQESLLGKMLKTIESIEEKRAAREEAWRREEIARSERKEKEWEREKSWIENRNAAMSRALEKLGCECFSWRCGFEEEESLMSMEINGGGRKFDEREEEKWRCDDEIGNLVDIHGWGQSEFGLHFYNDDDGLFGV